MPTEKNQHKWTNSLTFSIRAKYHASHLLTKRHTLRFSFCFAVITRLGSKIQPVHACISWLTQDYNNKNIAASCSQRPEVQNAAAAHILVSSLYTAVIIQYTILYAGFFQPFHIFSENDTSLEPFFWLWNHEHCTLKQQQNQKKINKSSFLST